MCNVTSTSCKVCCISDTKNKCCQKSQHRNYVLQNTSYTSVKTAVKHNTINLKSVFRSSVMHSSLSGRIDGVDSSGDKTTITTIPTVGVYFSSDKKTIATFPAFQDDLLSASPLEIRPQIRVNVVELIYD